MYFWWWLGDYCHGWYKRDVYVKRGIANGGHWT